MKQFLLFGTQACHLCELAQAMLVEAQLEVSGPSFSFEEVDISEDDDLFARYGLTIPVLQHEDKREINWPFDAQQLLDFVQS